MRALFLLTSHGMIVRVIYRLDRYLRGGDHRPFLALGYPGARFTGKFPSFSDAPEHAFLSDTEFF